MVDGPTDEELLKDGWTEDEITIMKNRKLKK